MNTFAWFRWLYGPIGQVNVPQGHNKEFMRNLALSLEPHAWVKICYLANIEYWLDDCTKQREFTDIKQYINYLDSKRELRKVNRNAD